MLTKHIEQCLAHVLGVLANITIVESSLSSSDYTFFTSMLPPRRLPYFPQMDLLLTLLLLWLHGPKALPRAASLAWSSPATLFTDTFCHGDLCCLLIYYFVY